MKTSQDGIDLIKHFEGCKLKPYLCSAGVPTIGFGNTFYEDKTPVTLQDPPITMQRAEELLAFILIKFEHDVSRLIKHKLTQPMFDALVCFTYNLGAGTLQRSTLRMKLNRGEIWDCAPEFLKYNKAGGKILKGLTRRREAESRLFIKGILEY